MKKINTVFVDSNIKIQVETFSKTLKNLALIKKISESVETNKNSHALEEIKKPFKRSP
jgi:hypothetical protein